MAKAPLSQTIILTEDGSPIPVTADNAAIIPPLIIATIETTLASSGAIASTVIGMQSLFIDLWARAAALSAEAEAVRTLRLAVTDRRVAAEARLAALRAIDNTLASSAYVASSVLGMAALFAAMGDRAAAATNEAEQVRALRLDVTNRRLSVTNRLTALEPK